MTLLTKKEVEQFVKNASSVASVPATTKDVTAALAGNKNAVVLCC
jgi:hypothetical protein